MRDLTKKESKTLSKGTCPFCNYSRWYEGPHGGFCVNIECAKCGARFNIGPGMFQQLIGEPQHFVPKRKGWLSRTWRRLFGKESLEEEFERKVDEVEREIVRQRIKRGN